MPGYNPTAVLPGSVQPDWFSGCQLWLRADQGITQSSGSVSQWNDLSGNGNNFTVGALNAPGYATNVYNGMPAVRGVDGTKGLTSTIPALGTSGTIVIVFSGSSLSATYIGASAGGTYNSILQRFSGALLEWFNGSGSDRQTLASSVSAGLHQVVISQVDGVSLVGYYDGVQAFSVVPNASINHAFNRLFGYGVGANGTNGDIVEVIEYAGVALNAAQVNTIFQYLGSRYGIATS